MRHFLLPFALLLSASLAAQVPSYVPTDGLIAWYPLDGDATDLGVNTLNGTEVGTTGADSREGTADGALEFNGSTHVNLGNSSLLNPPEMSVTCWFQIQNWNTQTGLNTILGRNLNNGSHRYGFNLGIFGPNNTSIGQTGLRFGFDEDSYSGTLIHDYDIPQSLDLNEWYHFGITMNLQEEELIFYLNGVVVATENIPSIGINPIDADVLMGFYRPNGDHSLNGRLDDIGMWNRTLNESEISSIYSETSPIAGCVEESACNYDAEANVDDGSCIPSGCMEEGACNYNAAAECEGEACDYSCCPGPGCCGAGTHWDANLATCIVDIPDTVDAACTLMNLQELASGYAALVEQNAALDSLLAACEGDGTAEASGPCAGQDHVTYQGYDYDIVEIGDQCWFAENLQTEAYNNGEPLQSDLNSGAWSTTNEGSYSIYNDEETNSINLGFLFNWHAVADGRGLCPLGWSVANEDAWIALEEYIESNLQADEIGLHLKSTESWTNGNGIDTYGFAAKAAGYRSNDSGEYNYVGNYTYFWSSTPSSSNAAFVRRLDYFSDNLTKYSGNDNLNQGFSVRCVKD